MNDEVIPTRPPNPGELLLRNKFFESVAAQDELMDKLAGQLLTIELAIPGIFATVLKFVRGDTAIIQLNTAFYFTYVFWMLALALTLYALIPKNWKVNPDLLRQTPENYNQELGLEDFYHLTARYKRRLLIASSILFFIGIISASFTF